MLLQPPLMKESTKDTTHASMHGRLNLLGVDAASSCSGIIRPSQSFPSVEVWSAQGRAGTDNIPAQSKVASVGPRITSPAGL